jgi:chromosome segregation ATPase
MDTATTTDTADGGTSTLDRRRDRAEAARKAAEAAQARVADLDAQLAAGEAQLREHEAALEQARQEITRRKQAIKATGRQRGKLQKARDAAWRAAAKSRRKAVVADAKYDKVVLADMVRREKASRAAQKTAPPAQTS